MTSAQDKANPPPCRRTEVIAACALHLGDSFEVLSDFPDNSVDAVVTDPPYGIRFMGKAWDSQDIENMMDLKKRKNTVRADGFKRHDGAAFAAGTYDTSLTGNVAFQTWTEEWAREAFRILKPGGHLLCFASPRTYRMTCGIEDAGFEIRDQIMWIFGSGFPKSHNLDAFSLIETQQTFEEWGTALKPAHEPIAFARKPFTGTVADNILQHGTAALNIGASRIPTSYEKPDVRGGDPTGRWPANIIHDGSGEVIAAFPEAQGQQAAVTGKEPSSKTNNVYSAFNGRAATVPRGDSGSAARFFYCAKASKEDRDEGLAGFQPKARDESRKEGNPGGDNPRNRGLALRTNHHPTVKPTDLMRYLCRLITPPGGVVLDPFMGSGSTGKAAVKDGFRFIGIEREEEYFEIACARIRDAQRQPDMFHEAHCHSPPPLVESSRNQTEAP